MILAERAPRVATLTGVVPCIPHAAHPDRPGAHGVLAGWTPVPALHGGDLTENPVEPLFGSGDGVEPRSGHTFRAAARRGDDGLAALSGRCEHRPVGCSHDQSSSSLPKINLIIMTATQTTTATEMIHGMDMFMN